MLEWENAAILNESLKPLSCDVITGIHQSLDDIGFTQDCSLYLAQNDGTLIQYAACMGMYILQVAIVVFISRWSYATKKFVNDKPSTMHPVVGWYWWYI